MNLSFIACFGGGFEPALRFLLALTLFFYVTEGAVRLKQGLEIRMVS
jgi:hypothetical protein